MNPLESTLSGKNVIEPTRSQSLKSTRIHAIEYSQEEKILRFYLLENQEDIQLLTTVKLTDKTQKQLSQIFNYLQGPIDLYVHGLIQHDSVWEADAVVLLPDYLIDVTIKAVRF